MLHLFAGWTGKARELQAGLPLCTVGLQRLPLLSQRVRHHANPEGVVHIAHEVARPLLSLGHVLFLFVRLNVLVYCVVAVLLRRYSRTASSHTLLAQAYNLRVDRFLLKNRPSKQKGRHLWYVQAFGHCCGYGRVCKAARNLSALLVGCLSNGRAVLIICKVNNLRRVQRRLQEVVDSLVQLIRRQVTRHLIVGAY